MAIKLSTGLVAGLLTVGSLRSIINDFRIKVYAGTAPTLADTDGTSNTTLWEPDDGAAGGIELDAGAVGRTLSMDSTTQNAAATATGTGSFFRILDNTDPNTTSTTHERIQGSCGLATDDPLPDMILSSTSFTISVTPTNPINALTLAFTESLAPGMSTGLVQHLLVTGSLKASLDGHVIKFYSGTVPANANAAISGDSTEIFELSVGGVGTGVTWESVTVGGAMVKETTETWQGTAIGGGGTVTYARICETADTLGASTTEERYQATCGLPGSGAGIELGRVDITGSSITVCPSFAIKLLTQAV